MRFVSHSAIKPTPHREVLLCVWSQARARGDEQGGDPRHAAQRGPRARAKDGPGHAAVGCSATTNAVTLRELRSRRADVIAVAGRYGASHLRECGSVALGMADDESDLDLLVDVEPGRTLLDRVALERDLAALLGCRVDVGTCLRACLQGRVENEVAEL